MATSPLNSRITFKERLAEHDIIDLWPNMERLGYTTIGLFGGAQGYWPQCTVPAMQAAFREQVVLPAAGMATNDKETGATCARIRRLFL